MKQAFEHPDADQQLDLGRQALAFSSDLADLYVALAALVRARREALAHHLRGPADPQTTFGAPAAPAAAPPPGRCGHAGLVADAGTSDAPVLRPQ